MPIGAGLFGFNTHSNFFFKKYNFQAIGSSYVSADKNILDEDSVLLKALMQSLVLQNLNV